MSGPLKWLVLHMVLDGLFLSLWRKKKKLLISVPNYLNHKKGLLWKESISKRLLCLPQWQPRYIVIVFRVLSMGRSSYLMFAWSWLWCFCLPDLTNNISLWSVSINKWPIFLQYSVAYDESILNVWNRDPQFPFFHWYSGCIINTILPTQSPPSPKYLTWCHLHILSI